MLLVINLSLSPIHRLMDDRKTEVTNIHTYKLVVHRVVTRMVTRMSQIEARVMDMIVRGCSPTTTTNNNLFLNVNMLLIKLSQNLDLLIKLSQLVGDMLDLIMLPMGKDLSSTDRETLLSLMLFASVSLNYQIVSWRHL